MRLPVLGKVTPCTPGVGIILADSFLGSRLLSPPLKAQAGCWSNRLIPMANSRTFALHSILYSVRVGRARLGAHNPMNSFYLCCV